MICEKTHLAYVAGFLDGDGSIYVRLKPNKTYKYGFQIAPYVVFYQKKSEEIFLQDLQSQLKIGYLRYRNDDMIEYTIGDRPSIHVLLVKLMPYLRLKQRQAKLMLEILEQSLSIKNAHEFLMLAELVDQFGKLNFSRKRIITADVVRQHLYKKNLLTL